MTMAERLEKKSEKVLDLLSELDDLYIWIEQELDTICGKLDELYKLSEKGA